MLPKRQHYVPQLLLRPFASIEKTPRLFVFDKQQGAIRRQATKEVAHECGYYNFALADNKKSSLEPILQAIDGKIAPVVRRITESASLASIDATQREQLAIFAAIQLARVPANRQIVRDIRGYIRDHLDANRPEPGSQAEAFHSELHAVSDDEEHVHFIGHFASKAWPTLAKKTWMLLSSIPNRPFYTSDNPVVYTDVFRTGESVGISSPTVEVYFPLSPHLCISMVSPEIGEILRGKPGFTQAIAGGTPMIVSEQNVIFQRSLQVAHSTRFVFCSQADFQLVKQMLSDRPDFASPPRVKIN